MSEVGAYKNRAGVSYDLEMLSCAYSRICSGLYSVDDRGTIKRFYPRPAQKRFLREITAEGAPKLHLILKARQIGFSTLIGLILFDLAVWHPQTAVGMIAHELPAAQRLMRRIVEPAYRNLPPEVQKALGGDWSQLATGKETYRNQSEVKFANGSSIVVGTQFRGGTLNALHVSELGKISAKYPDRATEIQTGAFNSLDENQWVFVESTAEGKMFRDMVETAQAVQATQEPGQPWPAGQFKLFFSPWSDEPGYKHDRPDPLGDEARRYFSELRRNHNLHFSAGQMSWWQSRLRRMLNDQSAMASEYPSTIAEAFSTSSEHAVFGQEIRDATNAGRLGRYPYQSESGQVFVALDLGFNDATAMVFAQRSAEGWNVFDYYENSGKRLDFYIDYLRAFKEKHANTNLILILPHDAGNGSLGSDPVVDLFRDARLGTVELLPRTKSLVADLRAMRTWLYSITINQEKASVLVDHLRAYRWATNAAGMPTEKIVHDEASHGVDSLRMLHQASAGGALDRHLYGLDYDMTYDEALALTSPSVGDAVSGY